MKKRPFNIEILRQMMGEDIVYLIGGGVVHIGAVATAYWRNEQVKVELITLPGHKEDQLALECASLACEQKKCTVTAIVGIHIDQASKEEIMLAVKTTREAMHEELFGEGK
ncbi:hypothetical protein [Brevibacillus laterosporus]|uniref:Prenylated flavin chaperone LpdD-like domain-containing protein n=1 Tax=Brevibacillus laterosporus TaxID=1465 RepID=A0AAP3G983_BRELA|nr:hypothetical protein [Brevibacillus laterosporus]MCR8978527.1 hypothetical protein [Brevibacillus laterosporus]MCZ0805682.1 hypothetical protein [Brevibacillus laterosporus]MCZ0824551.1 hypothetical protein [Brevibacillus laterosporus]MCZ0848455.1 hypothetical protein [Brevibacillus laterosporus]